MVRGLFLALVIVMTAHVVADAQVGTLHITVAIADGAQRVTAVPRHALLISDNPASAPPRRVLTTLEGAVDVRLAPGNYTVESERPVTVDGQAYQWTVIVDVVAGRDQTLALTKDNAEVVPVTDAAASASSPADADPSSLLARWQHSVVAIWTATTRGSGFLMDPTGLVVADQQVVGTASSLEVQLSQTVKVTGHVIASDVRRGIALIRINPVMVAELKVLPLECEKASEPLEVGQEVAALEAPIDRHRGSSVGAVESVLPNIIDTDLLASTGGSGGPAFAPNGRLIGVTVLVPERDGQRPDRTRIVRVGRVCELVDTSAEAIAKAPVPTAIHLPVERVGSVPQPQAPAIEPNPALYRQSSENFDIAFITPSQLVGPQAPENFANWSEYVETTPPVVFIRVTPKLVEGFWTKVARGAAMTQGMSIPPIKRPKPNFARMRVVCGETELVPVHPFTLEHHVTDNDTLVEGLYAFDPAAVAPTCKTLTLHLFSVKDPKQADTLVVDPKVIAAVWQDLARYR
jgi:hypothetical protein